MGLRNVVRAIPTDPFSRMAMQVTDLIEEVQRLRSIVRRDCLKVRGYDLEYRTLPTPGVYLVNKRDGDPNFGTATFLGA